MSDEKPIPPPETTSGVDKPAPKPVEDIVADWRAAKAVSQEKNAPLPPPVNIGREQQMLRYAVGTGLLLFSIALTTLTIWFDFSPRMRLLLVIPYWLAFVCLFQGSDKVCVLHASRGTCDLGKGTQPIEDSNLVARLKAKANWIYLKAFFCAVMWALLGALISRRMFE
jgi:hypothetical protein